MKNIKVPVSVVLYTGTSDAEDTVPSVCSVALAMKQGFCSNETVTVPFNYVCLHMQMLIGKHP